MKLQYELELGLPFEDIYHETLLNIVRTAGLFSSLGAGWFKQFGLTDAQFNVLLVLKYKDKELTQVDLSRRLVVTRASITSVLDRLEEKALVLRNHVAGNRRIHHVSLTPQGEELVERVEPLYRETLHQVLGELTEAECHALIGYLERVRVQAQAVLQEKDTREQAGNG